MVKNEQKEGTMNEHDKDRLERLERMLSGGNGMVVNPAKTSFLIGMGPILMLFAVVAGVTIPLYFKVASYQTQNYNYQVVDNAYTARRDCMLRWQITHRASKTNYANECDHIIVPSLPMLPPS